MFRYLLYLYDRITIPFTIISAKLIEMIFFHTLNCMKHLSDIWFYHQTVYNSTFFIASKFIFSINQKINSHYPQIIFGSFFLHIIRNVHVRVIYPFQVFHIFLTWIMLIINMYIYIYIAFILRITLYHKFVCII